MNAASSALPQIHHSFIRNRNAPLRFKPVKQLFQGVQPGEPLFSALRQGIGGGHHAAEILLPRVGQIIWKAEYLETVVEKRSNAVRQLRQPSAESIKARTVKTVDISFLPDNGTVFHPGVPNQGDLASSGQKAAAFPLERGGVKPVE